MINIASLFIFYFIYFLAQGVIAKLEAELAGGGGGGAGDGGAGLELKNLKEKMNPH